MLNSICSCFRDIGDPIGATTLTFQGHVTSSLT